MAPPIDHLIIESDHYIDILSCNSCGKLYYPADHEERACSTCLNYLVWITEDIKEEEIIESPAIK